MKTKKLSTKNLIAIAIFSLLFAVCEFVVGGVMGIVPITFIFFGVPAGIVLGIIYIYLRIKVPEGGAIIIQGILTAVLYAVIGNPIVVPVIIILSALLAELVSRIGNYRKFSWNLVGYILFSLGIWVGKLAPMLISAEEYKEYAVRTGMEAEYIDELLKYLSPTFLTIAAIATIIGCLIGGLISKKLLKKHFEKIGIV